MIENMKTWLRNIPTNWLSEEKVYSGPICPQSTPTYSEDQKTQYPESTSPCLEELKIQYPKSRLLGSENQKTNKLECTSPHSGEQRTQSSDSEFSTIDQLDLVEASLLIIKEEELEDDPENEALEPG